MTVTARPATCPPTVLAIYQCDEGTRKLVGQRINGKAPLNEIPAGDHGRSTSWSITSPPWPSSRASQPPTASTASNSAGRRSATIGSGTHETPMSSPGRLGHAM